MRRHEKWRVWIFSIGLVMAFSINSYGLWCGLWERIPGMRRVITRRVLRTKSCLPVQSRGLIPKRARGLL